MSLRFEKVLEQIANARRGELLVIDPQERKVRRLEELIRAKEALGDRIVICLGATLLVSALALPVYAFRFSNGYSYLPVLGSWQSNNAKASERNAANTKPVVIADPTATGSLHRETNELQRGEKTASSGTQTQESKPSLGRYVIHRATENSALIEGPDGLWWVTPGMTLPGAGRVIAIERSDNGWAVMTSDTTITQTSVRAASR
jgi:hypothetical protein